MILMFTRSFARRVQCAATLALVPTPIASAGAAVPPAPTATPAQLRQPAAATPTHSAPPLLQMPPDAQFPAVQPILGPSVIDQAASSGPGISLSFGAETRTDTLSDYSLMVLRDLLEATGVASARVTSTSRDAHTQARVMFDNLEARGPQAELRLYGANGRAVISTYVAGKQAGWDAHHIRQAMCDTIVALGKANVSHHCGDFRTLQVVDVDPNCLPPDKRAAFELACYCQVGRTLSRVIAPPVDQSYHLEIPQPAARRGALPSRSGALLIARGAAMQLTSAGDGAPLQPPATANRYLVRVSPWLARFVPESEYRRLTAPHSHARRSRRRRHGRRV